MSNTNSQPSDQRLPEWYDPFPEPNTMPKRWDLSEYGHAPHNPPRPTPADKPQVQQS